MYIARWVNRGVFNGLTPIFAGGRPQLLDEDAKRSLASVLESRDHEFTRDLFIISDVFNM